MGVSDSLSKSESADWPRAHLAPGASLSRASGASAAYLSFPRGSKGFTTLTTIGRKSPDGKPSAVALARCRRTTLSLEEAPGAKCARGKSADSDVDKLSETPRGEATSRP